jgi:hypothetical protein
LFAEFRFGIAMSGAVMRDPNVVKRCFVKNVHEYERPPVLLVTQKDDPIIPEIRFAEATTFFTDHTLLLNAAGGHKIAWSLDKENHKPFQRFLSKL